MQQSITAITESILQGNQLKRGDDCSFLLETDLPQLCTQANRLRKHFCGNQVDLCTIINGKSGRCSEDCKFCAQSSHNHSGCSEYAFLDADTIAMDAKKNASQGVHRYSIVTAGRKLSDADMEKSLAAYRKLRQESSISLCASHGFLSYDQFLALKEAGVNRYHENIETSRRYFPSICTTHSYQDKIDSIRLAQKAGLEVCSGGIIGMGETWEDRMDMALSLSELGISSIPINALSPIPGTPFENRERLSEDDILRTIGIFRFFNPKAQIRLAAGRSLMQHSGKRAFLSGANATITGDMLTTSGTSIQQDRTMLLDLGFDL
ncbi:MAG: biotin synthase BioB [Clostridiales bacterium]|jgi:biotin synthase|nr:biotin synthase BioB [Clostridiales bacterium]